MGSRIHLSLLVIAAVTALALSSCGGEGSSDRIFKVTGIDPCFEKVVIQVTQFDANEAHESDVATDGSAEATFTQTFVSISPATLRVWPTKVKASTECENKKLHVPYVKKVANVGDKKSPDKIEVSVAATDRKEAVIPTGQADAPKLPGQDGSTPDVPAVDTANPPAPGKVHTPGTLGLHPAVDKAVKDDATTHSGTDHGSTTAHGPAGDYGIGWMRDANGVYHAELTPPAGTRERRGPAMVFFANPDGCAKCVVYQWVRQSLTWDGDPKLRTYLDSDGTHETSSSAPQVDKQSPYLAQRPGASPYAEDVPGPPNGQSAGQVAAGFDAISSKAPPSPTKLVIGYEFWTYLVCVDPYYVVGHYEWSFEITVDIAANKFDPATPPAPTVKWVPGE
jgi:hypothetical protein